MLAILHPFVKVEKAIVRVFHPPKDPKAPCLLKQGRNLVVVKQPPCEVKK